jgi:hypothetical protein
MPKLSQNNRKLTPEYVRALCRFIHKDPVYSRLLEHARIAPVDISIDDEMRGIRRRFSLCIEIIDDATYRMVSFDWTDPEYDLRYDLATKLFETMSS